MSKTVQNDLKQSSLAGFMLRTVSTPINKNDNGRVEFNLSADGLRHFPPKTNGTSNQVSDKTTPEEPKMIKMKGNGKFQFMSKKRKTSFVEISDDSRSTEENESKSKMFAASTISDDLFASIDSVDASAKNDMSVNELYLKYASPKKSPEKCSAPQLTLKDKFDLDEALNKDQNYVNAIKKLDKSLEKVQHQVASTAPVPVLQTKPSAGKFKFNKPKAARMAELSSSNEPSEINVRLASEINSKVSSFINGGIEPSLSNVNRLGFKKTVTSTITSAANSTAEYTPDQFNLSSSIPKMKDISTVTISDDEESFHSNNVGFVPATKLLEPSLIYKTADRECSSSTRPLSLNSR